MSISVRVGPVEEISLGLGHEKAKVHTILKQVFSLIKETTLKGHPSSRTFHGVS